MPNPYAALVRESENSEPTIVAAMSIDAYTDVCRASGWVYRVEGDRTLLETVKAADRSLTKQLRFCQDHALNLVLVQARVNAALGGYLSATRMFADQIAHVTLRAHPNREALRRQIAEEQRRRFDGSFAYRFLSRFRNYVQHRGYPHSLVLSRVLVGSNDPNGMRLKTKFLISPKLLLRSYDGWGPVGAELAAMKRRMNVMPLVREMTREIIELDIYVQQLVLPEILSSRRLLQSILPEDWRSGGFSLSLLGEIETTAGDSGPLEVQLIGRLPLPTHILSQIEHWPEQLPNTDPPDASATIA